MTLPVACARLSLNYGENEITTADCMCLTDRRVGL